MIKPIRLLAFLIMLTAMVLYVTTWHKAFEGYELETANSALKLFEGDYDIKRAGLSSIILYIPFVFIYKLFGLHSLSVLSIVPLIYSAATLGLMVYVVWYLTKKRSLSLVVPLLIMVGSAIWPYANIGMEYQIMFYLTLLLVVLLRWKNNQGSIIWSAVIFALLCVAKSYGPIFGLPLVLFVYLSSPSSERLRNIAVTIIPASIIFVIYIFFQWYSRGSVAGVYSLSHEFQIWTWWEGFYGMFFSIGKGFFFFSPLLVLALFKWRQFYNDHKATAIFILTSFILLILINAPFSYWTDETPGVRKLIPVIGLLHLPLIYYFNEKFSWRKIKIWILLIFVAVSVYVQILNASYVYGKQLQILHAGNVDSLQSMRYIPQLSLIPIYHSLLSGYIFDLNNKLIYSENTWFRWTKNIPDITLNDVEIDLKPYQNPDIYWLKTDSFKNSKYFFGGLLTVDVLLVSSVVKKYMRIRREENI